MTVKTPEHLWSVPLYIPDWLPPLTDKMVRDAEKRLGVQLPKAYIQALNVQNGGYLRRKRHRSGTGIPSIDGISHNRPWRDWSEEKEFMAEQGIDTIPEIDGLIPISGDGHEYVCFDYRACGPQGEPCITTIDVETFSGAEMIARDFTDLLIGLVPDDHLHLGFITDDPLPIAKERLGKALGVAFTNQGDDLHGYTIFRTQIGPAYGREKKGEMAGGWLWLSSNLVDRGFLRKEHHELYADRLVHVTGQALRYPFEPNCSLVMTISRDTLASLHVQSRLDRLPYPHQTVTA